MKTKNMVVKHILAAILIAAMSMILIVHPAAAEATRVDFINYNIACEIVSQTVWVSDGGVTHIRDRQLNSVVTSTSDYFAGPGHIFANANLFNPAMGIGTYFGTLDIYPTTHADGYWFGHWSMQITENGYQGLARLKGYGSLQGMLAFSTLAPLPPTVLANFKDLCGGNQPIAGTYVEGYYLVPGGE